MPKSYEDVVTPVVSSGPVKGWAETLERNINQEWEQAQKKPFPSRALAWNRHDPEIQSVVKSFNNHLASAAGYQELDWHIVKAMLFVETGPNADDWVSKPMQSDNIADPGHGELMHSPEKEDLIVPASLRSAVAFPNRSAEDNIAAGVGYLLYRAARFGRANVVSDPVVRTVTAHMGESLYSVARSVGTTEENIESLNPHVNFDRLKPGTEIKYQKSHDAWVVTGWEHLDPQNVYHLYNANPQSHYAEKLTFAYDLIKKTRYLQ